MTNLSAFKVSVITPVYNAEITLERSLESALSEPTVQEVILIEDQSPDASLDLCRRLEADHPGRVRLFRHPDGRNHGAGPSRNLGIQQARSPFIAFLDADDYYLSGRFRRDAQILMANDDIDGVYNALGTDIQDADGKQWYARSGRPQMTTLDPPPPPEKLFFRMAPIGQDGYFSLDTLTLRRNVFQKTPMFSALPLAQDTLFCIQLAAQCHLAGGETRHPVAMRGVHARNRIQDTHRARIMLDTVLKQLTEWSAGVPLPPDKKRAIEQARIQTCMDWSDLLQHLRRHPFIGLLPRTWENILRWTLVRRFPDDPWLPGLFPAYRRKTTSPATG